MKYYQKIIDIPNYLLQSLSSDGISQNEDGSDIDDLRVSIVLSGNTRVLVDIDCRIIVTSTGITIEGLKE